MPAKAALSAAVLAVPVAGIPLTAALEPTAKMAAPEAACREASDGGLLAGLCASSWTSGIAPAAVGVLDAFKEQFGTVSGIVSLLAFTVLGLLLSALSGGVGVVATLIKALCGIAIFWTVMSMFSRLAAAIAEVTTRSKDDPRYWRALRSIGKLGGELLLIVLMTVAGYKLGQMAPVKDAVGSMMKGLQSQMERLGIRPPAPAPELRAAFGEPAAAPSVVGPAGNRSNLRPPEPPPEDAVGAISKHGAERIAGRAPTRAGVLSETDILATRINGATYDAANGTIVRVLEIESGRFNMVVDGEKGFISSYYHLRANDLARLTRKFGIVKRQ